MTSLVNQYFTLKLMKARHLLGFLVFILVLGCHKPIQYTELNGYAMGTTYSIKLISNTHTFKNIDPIQLAVDSIFTEIDNQMSTYKSESEISKFNRLNKSETIKISDGFSQVLLRSIYWSEKTNENHLFFGSLVFLPRFELTGIITLAPGSRGNDGTDTYKDFSIFAHIHLLKEKIYFPSQLIILDHKIDKNSKFICYL